jgi:hypothetical protein
LDVDSEPDLLSSKGRDSVLCEATNLRKVDLEQVRKRSRHAQSLAGQRGDLPLI